MRAELLRSLITDAPAEPERPSYVSAASGCVHLGRSLLVIADDEQKLAVFPDGGGRGRWVPLLGGELPLDPDLRKAVKADFETLTSLPPFGRYTHGALLALGSGSDPRRGWGVVLPLDEHGEPLFEPRRVDLRPLYDALRDARPLLNIEGALVREHELVLLHRGTHRKAKNGLITLDLSSCLACFDGRTPVGADVLRSIADVTLPELDGIELSFTDAMALGGDRFAFSAVAEDTADPKLDGRCAGSAIGIATLDGKVLSCEPLEPVMKVEGIAKVGDKLWLVTDADDPTVAARLWQVDLPE